MNDLSKRLPIFQLNQGEFAMRVSAALRSAFAGRAKPVKEIAALADVSIGTAQNWWDGSVVPQALHWERLKATVPALDAEARRLRGDAPRDIELEALAHELLSLAQRRLAR